MAKITITHAGLDESEFKPGSNTNLPTTLTALNSVAADVSPDVSAPAIGLRTIKVELIVSALANSGGSASGEFVVYDGASQLFTATYGAAGGSHAETTTINVANGNTRSFTLKWRAVNAGTYLPANQSVILRFDDTEWDA